MFRSKVPLNWGIASCIYKKNGIESSIQIGNALVTMYAEGGSTQKADLAFELMSRKNMISWMVLISAFSQAGDLEKPRFFFLLIKCISEVLYLGIL